MNRILNVLLVLLFSLTTISILVPSSPLFAEESGTLYPWETSSGNVWKIFGDVRFQPQYKGEILNGKPNGVGILYNGDPSWDKKNVVYFFSARSIYIGEWKEGNMHGLGTFTHYDGSKKTGIFKHGKDWDTTWYGSLGNVIKTFSKGKILLGKKYKGILFSRKSGGEFSWFQTKTNISDGNYEGKIKNGKPNGLGKVIFSNGESYEGTWKEGELNGQGTYQSSDGTKYIGKWINGKYHGKGTLTYSDGLRIVGEFKKGSDWNTKWYNVRSEVTTEYKEGVVKK